MLGELAAFARGFNADLLALMDLPLSEVYILLPAISDAFADMQRRTNGGIDLYH